MANITIVKSSFSPRYVSTINLATIRARKSLALVTSLVFSAACMAQDQTPLPSQPPTAPEPQATAPAPGTRPALATIPAGTRFALILTNPVSTNTTHRGDEIQAQTTAPVTAGDQVIIPAGVFVQGKVDHLRRDGDHGEMLMQSVSVIFPDGYVAKIDGPVSIQSAEYTAWLTPSSGTKAAAIIAPIAGMGIGAGIGAAMHTTQSTTLGGTTITSSTPKGIGIGSGVGLGVGALVAILVLTHSHQFFIEAGSPMQMSLPQPLTITENQIPDANREARYFPMTLRIPTSSASSQAFDRVACDAAATPGTSAATPAPNPCR